MEIENLVLNFCQMSDSGNTSEANEVFGEIVINIKPTLEKLIQKKTTKNQYSQFGDDILQAVLQGVHKSLKNPNRRWIKGKIKGCATFKTWASSLVNFKYTDALRKESRHQRNKQGLEELEKIQKESKNLGPLELLSYKEFKETIFAEIGKLPEVPRKILLKSLEGFKGVEIANELNQTPVYVSRNLRNARRHILETMTF